MVNGDIVLSRSGSRAEGKVVGVRAVPGGTFVTLEDHYGEYPIDGPFMWGIEEFISGIPEVGNMVRLQRKKTTVIGPVTQVDLMQDGYALHVALYPVLMFVGQRRDAWTLAGVWR